MNKQQALEAVLRKVRGWEAPHEEVKLPDGDTTAMVALAASYRTIRRTGDITEEAYREHLVQIAAAALYLLTDEVEVVEGRLLDEWLVSNEDQRLAMFARGEVRVVIEAPSPAPLPQDS